MSKHHTAIETEFAIGDRVMVLMPVTWRHAPWVPEPGTVLAISACWDATGDTSIKYYIELAGKDKHGRPMRVDRLGSHGITRYVPGEPFTMTAEED